MTEDQKTHRDPTTQWSNTTHPVSTAASPMTQCLPTTDPLITADFSTRVEWPTMESVEIRACWSTSARSSGSDGTESVFVDAKNLETQNVSLSHDERIWIKAHTCRLARRNESSVFTLATNPAAAAAAVEVGHKSTSILRLGKGAVGSLSDPTGDSGGLERALGPLWR
jgi:hypothetical protein